MVGSKLVPLENGNKSLELKQAQAPRFQSDMKVIKLPMKDTSGYPYAAPNGQRPELYPTKKSYEYE